MVRAAPSAVPGLRQPSQSRVTVSHVVRVPPAGAAAGAWLPRRVHTSITAWPARGVTVSEREPQRVASFVPRAVSRDPCDHDRDRDRVSGDGALKKGGRLALRSPQSSRCRLSRSHVADAHYAPCATLGTDLARH